MFKDPRKPEYLNAEGVDRPLRSPIPHDTLVAARGYRNRGMAVDRLDPPGTDALPPARCHAGRGQELTRARTTDQDKSYDEIASRTPSPIGMKTFDSGNGPILSSPGGEGSMP